MTLDRFVFATVLALVPGMSAINAQKPVSSNPSASPAIHLNVVVTNKAGTPISGLSQQDFTILDNKNPQPITSFKVIAGGKEPVEVILVLDAVNSGFNLMSFQSSEVEKFLRSHDGKLDHPTTLAIFTDKGTQIDKAFFDNGNIAADTLAHYAVGLREIHRGSQWGDTERMQLSLQALHQLIAYAATLPGRKIVLWISPGWPLLSGANVYLDEKQEQGIFNDAVSFSNQMRRANMTLYNLNSVGPGETLSREDYYQGFLNDISKPSQVRPGNIGLQVLAIHSGGLAIEGNSDIAGMISRCLADASTWYEIDYNPPQADKPNDYHHIEVKVNHPGLTARTTDHYYANPTVGLQR